MTRFARHSDETLKTLGAAAIREALADAGLAIEDVEMAFVANALAALTNGQVSVVGQTILAEAGIHGIPAYNVDNACAGSASALNLATHAIAAGAAKRVLVVGVEKLYHDDRAITYRALNGAADLDWVRTTGVDAERESVFVNPVYESRLASYSETASLRPEVLAAIAVKNRRHAGSNPLAQYREPLTVEEVLAARTIVEPITSLMCAPIGDGASAVVVTSAELATDRPVWVLGSAVSMGSPGLNGVGTLRRVAEAAYRQAQIGPEDVDVAEVQDRKS